MALPLVAAPGQLVWEVRYLLSPAQPQRTTSVAIAEARDSEASRRRLVAAKRGFSAIPRPPEHFTYLEETAFRSHRKMDPQLRSRMLEPQLRSRMLSTTDQVSVADHGLVRSSADARSQLRPQVWCCKQDRGKSIPQP